MSLRKQAISGIKWTASASAINAIIQLIQLSILTRFLEPEDFGLMAVALIVISFSQMFVDMGFSNAIIYKDKISKEQLSSLYWLNILTGLLIFILLLSISSIIADFYNNTQLVPLINLVAATFLIKPWGHQFMVLLQKRLKFDIISRIDVISRLCSFIIVVILAYNDFRVYSLAFGSLVFTLFATVGYFIFGRRFHKPKLIFINIKIIYEFITFGLYQMGENILRYFSAEFDTILIGKLLGLEVLGIYNVAKSLVTKPYGVINPIITKVTFPLMSRIQDDIMKLRSIFLKIVNNLSYVNIPLYFMISAFAKPIIIILFGEEWLDAVPILQILSLTYLLRAISSPSGSLLLSQGKANVAFFWNLSVFVLYPSSIIIGSHWGIIGVTISTLLLQLVLFFPNWKYIVFKTCNADIWNYSRNIFLPLVIVFIPLLIAKISIIPISNLYIQFISGIVVFSSIFIYFINRFNKPLYEEVKNLISISIRKKTN